MSVPDKQCICSIMSYGSFFLSQLALVKFRALIRSTYLYTYYNIVITVAVCDACVTYYLELSATPTAALCAHFYGSSAHNMRMAMKRGFYDNHTSTLYARTFFVMFVVISNYNLQGCRHITAATVDSTSQGMRADRRSLPPSPPRGCGSE